MEHLNLFLIELFSKHFPPFFMWKLPRLFLANPGYFQYRNKNQIAEGFGLLDFILEQPVQSNPVFPT